MTTPTTTPDWRAVETAAHRVIAACRGGLDVTPTILRAAGIERPARITTTARTRPPARTTTSPPVPDETAARVALRERHIEYQLADDHYRDSLAAATPCSSSSAAAGSGPRTSPASCPRPARSRCTASASPGSSARPASPTLASTGPVRPFETGDAFPEERHQVRAAHALVDQDHDTVDRAMDARTAAILTADAAESERRSRPTSSASPGRRSSTRSTASAPTSVGPWPVLDAVTVPTPISAHVAPEELCRCAHRADQHDETGHCLITACGCMAVRCNRTAKPRDRIVHMIFLGPANLDSLSLVRVALPGRSPS